MLRARIALALAGCAVLLSAPSAGATTPASSCAGMSATSDVFINAGPPVAYWLENMGFDGHGGMWVSQLFLNKLVRYDSAGKPGASVDVSSPGASLLGPDGQMYAAFGDSPTGVIPGMAPAGIVRFDPAAAAPVAKPFGAANKMANGAAFDAAGNLYVADTVGSGVVKYLPDGKVDPSFALAAPIAGGDGLAVIGDTLYATLLTDLRSSIVAIPLDHPAGYSTLVSLTDIGVPLLLDDIAAGPDGALYVASNIGQLIRVDPATGGACVLLSGLPPIDSVRFPVAFGAFDAQRDLFMSSEVGQIIHARVTGMRVAAPPAMSVRVLPPAVRAGHALTLRVSVRSDSSNCRAGVRIRAGGRSAMTGADGRARLRVRFRSVGPHTVRADKAGCADAMSRVVVRRPRR